MIVKVNSLVPKHLENIGRDAIEKYQKLIRQCFHGKSGGYALYHKDKCISWSERIEDICATACGTSVILSGGIKQR